MRLGSFQLPNDASLSYAEYGTSTGKPEGAPRGAPFCRDLSMHTVHNFVICCTLDVL